MTKTISILILLSCSFLLVKAQNETPAPNYLQWGKINIPLNELVNGTNAIKRLHLNEILESASSPMVLFKNGKNAKLKSMSIFITKENRTSSPQFLNVDNYDVDDAMDTHGKAFLKAHLHEGEYIYLNRLKGMDEEEHFITIQVLYKNPPLVLDFTLPKIPKGEVFGFQIVENKGEKSLVKVDTTDENNQRIYNTYKNYDSYQIVHIPKFKTTRRFLAKKDFLKIPNETLIDLIENENIKNIDQYRIPEFSEYNGDFIELKWGGMRSIDDPNRRRELTAGEAVRELKRYEEEKKEYDQYDLLDAVGSRFLLSQGFKNYSIKRMKVVLSNRNSTPISYETDNINHPELQTVLEKIEPNTIILITDILISNDKDEFMYFPPSFIFKIGK